MGDLQKNFKKIINDLENNIENKKDLEYIKTQIYNISVLFLDELDKLADLNMNKINALIERHKVMDDKMQKLENTMNNIEKELFIEEEPYEFEIVCPYCNYEFFADFTSELKSEVECPECNNIIELDWNEEHECGGECSGCHGHDCDGHHEEFDEEEQDEIDDDEADDDDM